MELLLRHGDQTQLWELNHLIHNDPYSRLLAQVLRDSILMQGVDEKPIDRVGDGVLRVLYKAYGDEISKLLAAQRSIVELVRSKALSLSLPITTIEQIHSSSYPGLQGELGDIVVSAVEYHRTMHDLRRALEAGQLAHEPVVRISLELGMRAVLVLQISISTGGGALRGSGASCTVGALIKGIENPVRDVLDNEGLLETYDVSMKSLKEMRQVFSSGFLQYLQDAEVAPECLLTSMLPPIFTNPEEDEDLGSSACDPAFMTNVDRKALAAELKRRIDDTPAFKHLQEWVLFDIIAHSQTGLPTVSGREGSIIAIRAAERAFGSRGYGRDTLSHLLGGDVVDFMTAWINELHESQKSLLWRVERTSRTLGPVDSVSAGLLSLAVTLALALTTSSGVYLFLSIGLVVLGYGLYKTHSLVWRLVLCREYVSGDALPAVGYAMIFAGFAALGSALGVVIKWVWNGVSA